MCGIVGYTGPRNATEILMSALHRLEYRGYDSAGIAVAGSKLQIHKDKGEIAVMEGTLPSMKGGIGVAHTRWATCGKPSKENAHPFRDCTGKIALIHNGIIENFSELKSALLREGHKFTSETDTEVLVHLLEKHDKGDLTEAMLATLREVKGTYALVAVKQGSDKLVAARKENPLVIGLGVGENFVASDVTAMLEHTNKVVYLMDGEIAEIGPRSVRIMDGDGRPIERKSELVTWSAEDAKKGGFEHFMLKEIYDEPEAVRNTLIGNLEADPEWGSAFKDVSSVRMVACGTSYYAAMVGKYVMEKVAKLPTNVELASEFRYSSAVQENPLVVFISQSGETADTLAAAREAKRRGYRTLAITNVVGSTLSREVEETLYTRAGPEIGVAATKTFIAQLVMLYLLSMRMGASRGTIGADELRSIRTQLLGIPKHIRTVLDQSSQLEEACAMLSEARDVFYLGRSVSYPVMLEGALKLKEISYIHAEGYAAGELKHGPLALIGDKTPVVAACVRDHTYDKMISNLSEVKARDAPVIAIAQEGDKEIERLADLCLYVPAVPPFCSPFLVTVLLQLMAYNVAKKRGCPIDKPRNLAKSVTVD
ncbi:MAG: glutamine--fructose-6-phosphate transaminase (isomerizing) [Methanomassiliicoccales archaeon]|nr:glutamine--fructose-6-phosphate transaminase (isomerizing) [Methanomassiliicoccales archaeon]